MHIPDGFLSVRTAATAGVLSVAGLAVALRETRLHLPPRKVPVMGLAAAFVFAAQMLNFPVAGGTSGHLVGGVLAAVLLGPSAAVVVLASVLTIQCLVFADGGILPLGANVLNMAVIGAGLGGLLYRAGARLLPGPRGRLTSVFIASWCATVVAAIACAGELALSGVARWGVVFPAMTVVHMLIGLGEAIITALIVVAIRHAQPELIEGEQVVGAGRNAGGVAIGVTVALGLALFVSPFACRWPDGLDHVAETIGLPVRTVHPAPFADYRIPGVGSAALATALAGGIGTVLVFAVGLLLARTLAGHRRVSVPAGVKVALALAAVLAALATPRARPDLLAALAALLVCHAALARVPWLPLLRRMLLLEPLVVCVAGLAFFQPGGGSLFLWLAARSTLCLLALVLLTSTLPFHEGLAVLRRLHVPRLMVTTMALAHRYLHVLAEESLRMRRARASRTFVAGRWRAWRSLSTVAAQLFLRSMDRAERVYAAMCARGWR